MLNYPLTNTTSSGATALPTASVAKHPADALIGEIPLIGDIAGSLVNLLGIDFNCINAAFPPKKADKQTNAFIQKLLNSTGYNAAITGSDTQAIEIAANKALKIIDYMIYWREKTGDGRSGCTRDGEYLASRISAEYANKIIESLQSVFRVSISHHTASYTSGFNGAPSRPTSYRQLKLYERKTAIPVNAAPTKADGSQSAEKAPPPNTDSYPLTWDLLGWVLFFLGLLIGLPVLIYQLFVKKKNKKKTKRK